MGSALDRLNKLGIKDYAPGEIGISDVQARNAQTAAVANKPAAVIKPAIKPAPNVPTIHALGAGDYGASKRTRLDNTVNAGIKSTQASFANIRGQLLAPTGELTIGQNAQAAVKGISQQTAEAQKTASQRKYQAKAYALAGELAKQSAEDTAKAKEGLGKGGRTLVDVGVAGTQMLGDLAMNAVLPGSALAAMTARSYGQSSQQARQAGANEIQQVGYGAAAATVEALTEKLFDGLAGLYGGGVADDVVEKVIGKIAKSGKGMTALRALANFSGEGLEEIVSDAVNPIIRSIYDGKSVGENYSQEKVADWLHDGLVGGILGLAGAGTQVITGQNAQKNAEAKVANGYASFKPMTEAEQAAHDKVLALNPQPAKQTAPDIVKILAGTYENNSDAQSEATEQATTQDNAKSVITPAPTENAPTAKQDTPTEIVQPVQPEVAQQASSAAAVAEKPKTFAFTNPQTGELIAEADSLVDAYNTSVKIYNSTGIIPSVYERTNGESHEISNAEINDRMLAQTDGLGATGEIVQPNPAANATVEEPAGPHIDDRSYSDVSSRKVKAFQYDHPELHPYFVEAANGLDYMLSTTHKGERYAIKDEDGYYVGVKGTKRSTTPEVAALLDYANLSSAQIKKAIDDLRSDHGQENYAAAKKVEIALDDMLTNGFEIEGYYVPANTEYINAKNALKGNGGLDGYSMSEEEWNSLMSQGDGLGAADKGFTGEPTPFDVWSDNTPASQMHPVGENPTRAIDLPKVNPQGQNTMATGRTVMEAEATPNSRIPEIQQYMVDGNLSYVPVENSTLAENATQGIENNGGWEVAHTKWVKAVSSGKTSPELVAMGATLLNNAGNTSTVSAGEYLDLLTDYSELLHRSGQALQAARILKTLSPEGRLYAIQRSVESMVEEMKNGQDITINPNLIDAYREAQSDEARDYALSNIEQNIADQIPSTLLDKWTALRYVNMLGNFKTQGRNIGGNAVMGVTAKAKNELRAGIEHLASAVTGGKYERTTSLFVSPELLNAARLDFTKVRDAALGESKYMDAPGSTQIQRSINDKRQIFSIPVLEAYRKATNWAMEQGDVIFSRATYADALAGYLKAHGYTAEQLSNGSIPTEALDKARLFAIKEAQEATFRDTNAVSKAVSSIGRGPNAGKVTKVISEGILPFRKTPANVAVRAEEYSPLGVLNTVVKTVQAVKGRGNVTGNDVINSLSKTLTGSSLFYLGWVLAKSGLLRGKDDDEGREAFDKLNGHQDYSLELPDGTSYTMDWMTPAAMPIFMGAQLFNVSDENGIDLKAIESALSSIGDPLIEMSMLSGVNDALGNIKYADNNIVQFLANASVSYLTQGLTNTLLGQVERTTETTRQTTFTDRNSEMPAWLQPAIGKASAKTPGVDYNQRDYIDAWGRTQSTGDVSQRIFQNFFSPGYTSAVKDDAVSSELQRLYDAGQVDVLPKYSDESTKIGDTTLGALPKEQYTEFVTTKGRTQYELVGELFNSQKYKKMDDDGKAAAVKAIYDYATGKAKLAVDPNSDVAKWIARASKESDPLPTIIGNHSK